MTAGVRESTRIIPQWDDSDRALRCGWSRVTDWASGLFAYTCLHDSRVLLKRMRMGVGLKPLEFTDCLTDSPYFRENLHYHERELEKTSQQIKRLVKEVKDLLLAAKSKLNWTHFRSELQWHTDFATAVYFFIIAHRVSICSMLIGYEIFEYNVYVIFQTCPGHKEPSPRRCRISASNASARAKLKMRLIYLKAWKNLASSLRL